MSCKKSRRAYQLSLLQTASIIMVTIPVLWEHPLLVLKRNLDWPGILDVLVRYLRASGRNVDHGPGRPLELNLYMPIIVLMHLKNLNSRQMEEYLAENGPARAFIDWEDSIQLQVRDHSNLARIMDSLGEDGKKDLNGLILRHAVELGFADPSKLSGDTTAQELPIGYPHEAGILEGLAKRVLRTVKKLASKGKHGLSEAQAQCETIIGKAKEYHLFAKVKVEKTKLLNEMVQGSEILMEKARKLITGLSEDTDKVVTSARGRLLQMVDVGEHLLPQILYWLKTGFVAKGKIIHAGINKARSIVRNKPGKKVEFGLQYLLCMLGGGYLFGEVIEKPTGETKMPLKCLSGYRGIFGEEQTPEMITYDRGGWSKPNVKMLAKEGIKKVGIQPKGQASWAVNEQDQKLVMSERGKMEGKIGTLKSDKYGFNKPKERTWQTVCAAGQKSIISLNLNKLMRDLVNREEKIMVTV